MVVVPLQRGIRRIEQKRGANTHNVRVAKYDIVIFTMTQRVNCTTLVSAANKTIHSGSIKDDASFGVTWKTTQVNSRIPDRDHVVWCSNLTLAHRWIFSLSHTVAQITPITQAERAALVRGSRNVITVTANGG